MPTVAAIEGGFEGVLAPFCRRASQSSNLLELVQVTRPCRGSPTWLSVRLPETIEPWDLGGATWTR